MKLITWNVFRHNKKIISLMDYITGYDPDVVCLQEVREQELERIQRYCASCNLETSKQFFIGKKDKKTIQLYNVILTRHDIRGYVSIAHDTHDIKMPPRYRYSFSRLDINSLYIDLRDLSGNNYRIFNVHFECVASPTIRLKRLEQMRNNFCPSAINVIAGDFNTFSNPLISAAVAPLYGNFSLSDFFINERKEFKKEIDRMGMLNPFAGTNTFKYMTGQYDYILIPKFMKVSHKQRLTEDKGSDHHGLLLEMKV